jgi:hypothetical protein
MPGRTSILGRELIRQGLAAWMPDFQRDPTPSFAATVLGIPREVAEAIDDKDRRGLLESAEWDLQRALKEVSK